MWWWGKVLTEGLVEERRWTKRHAGGRGQSVLLRYEVPSASRHQLKKASSPAGASILRWVETSEGRAQLEEVWGPYMIWSWSRGVRDYWTEMEGETKAEEAESTLERGGAWHSTSGLVTLWPWESHLKTLDHNFHLSIVGLYCLFWSLHKICTYNFWHEKGVQWLKYYSLSA